MSLDCVFPEALAFLRLSARRCELAHWWLQLTSFSTRATNSAWQNSHRQCLTQIRDEVLCSDGLQLLHSSVSVALRFLNDFSHHWQVASMILSIFSISPVLTTHRHVPFPVSFCQLPQ